MFSVGTSDLASGLSQVLLALVVLGFIASVVGIRAKKSGSTSAALDVAASVSFGWVVLCVLGALFVGWQTLLSSTVTIQGDIGLANAFWERDATADALPALVRAYPTAASIDIDGLPLGIRMLLFTTGLLNLALVAVPAVVIRVIAVRAAAGDPFAPRVAKTLWGASIFVMIAGVIRDLLDPIGQALAAQAVWTEGGPLAEGPFFQLTVQIWPFAAALVLAALAAVFRHGHRLQRETEGLI